MTDISKEELLSRIERLEARNNSTEECYKDETPTDCDYSEVRLSLDPDCVLLEKYAQAVTYTHNNGLTATAVWMTRADRTEEEILRRLRNA